jgi:Uma2 family endonuclease
MSLPSTDFVTPAEYLAIERTLETKNEYIAGQMHEMSGPKGEPHHMIVGNLAGELHDQMRGRDCVAFIADMRLKIRALGVYTYADVAIVSGKRLFEDAELDTLLNPTAIIEVLSPSTEAYDRGEKFAHYRRLESLREYVLVAQNKMRVEHFRREGEEWILSEISAPDGTLHLASIDCHVALAAIYEKVEFDVAAR